MPTNYSQYQIPQTITMFTVHGEEGANAFPVAPGQTKDGVIGYRNKSTGALYTNQGSGTIEPYE